MVEANRTAHACARVLLHNGNMRAHSSWHLMAVTSRLAIPPMWLGIVCSITCAEFERERAELHVWQS